MAKQKPLILNKFSGGIAQDDYLTTGKQVLYTENLNINKDSYFLSLVGEGGGRYTTTDKANGFFSIDGLAWSYTDDGKIYNINGTLQYTFTGNPAIEQAFLFNGYVYFLVGVTLYRITQAHALAESWTGNVNIVTITGDSLTAGRNAIPVVVLLNDVFYIGLQESVYKITKDGISTDYDIWDGDVIGITRIGGVFKVYTDTGVVAFWDGESTAVDSFIEVQDTVRAIQNNGKIDYIVAGKTDSSTRLLVSSGYGIQELTQTRASDRLDKSLFKIDTIKTQEITKLGDTIYFKQDNSDGNYNILSYGTLNTTLSKGFNIPLAESSIGDYEEIYALKGVQLGMDSLLWVSYKNGYTYYVERMNIKTTSSGTIDYKESGYFQTTVLDMGSRSQKKKIEEICVVTSDCDANNTIELSLGTDGGSCTSIKTINSGTSLTRTKIYSNASEFFEIGFKVTLTSDGTTTPKFYEIQIKYSIIEE